VPPRLSRCRLGDQRVKNPTFGSRCSQIRQHYQFQKDWFGFRKILLTTNPKIEALWICEQRQPAEASFRAGHHIHSRIVNCVYNNIGEIN
jgi:hypothetical protein